MRLPPSRNATPAQLALLPVALLAWFAVTFAASYALWRLHWFPNTPRPFRFRTETSGLLIVLPSLFASVAPALMAANFAARLLPPWKRTLDREDKEFRGDDFPSAQRGLVTFAVLVAAAAAPLMLVGVLLGRG